MSLWNHFHTNVDEYPSAIRVNDQYALECVDAAGRVETHVPACRGHWYNSYPVGGPVLTAPLVIAEVEILRAAHPLLTHFHSSNPAIQGFFDADFDAAHALIEQEAASFLLAASVVIMYFIARRYLAVTPSVWLALLFALATSAYSVAGRALWQHTPSMLLLAIIIYMLLAAEERPSLAGWAGLPVALSYTVRPTDSLFVLIFTAYVAVRHRAFLLRYLLAAAPVAIAFVAYNESVYHAILSPYYHTSLDGLWPRYWNKLAIAMAGNLISPSRGLFVYTPVFLFSAWAMIRKKWGAPVAPWLAALAVAHWIAISAYIANWWGGHSYGPRFFTDLMPVFVVFLIPYLASWSSLSRATRIVFVATALIGLAIHLRGGWSQAVYQWNINPNNIDQHPERNWDWSDPQFLRSSTNPRVAVAGPLGTGDLVLRHIDNFAAALFDPRDHARLRDAVHIHRGPGPENVAPVNLLVENAADAIRAAHPAGRRQLKYEQAAGPETRGQCSKVAAGVARRHVLKRGIGIDQIEIGNGEVAKRRAGIHYEGAVGKMRVEFTRQPDHLRGNICAVDLIEMIRERSAEPAHSATEIERASAARGHVERFDVPHQLLDIAPPGLKKRVRIPTPPFHLRVRRNCPKRVRRGVEIPIGPQPIQSPPHEVSL